MLFFAAFLVLVLFEIFEINTSLRIILDVNQEPEALKNARGVRINFDNYNQVVGRIEQADTFEPANNIGKNPF